MKVRLLIIFFLCAVQLAHAQFEYIDTLLAKIKVEKDEDKRFEYIFDIFSPMLETDPNQYIETGYLLLRQSQEIGDQIGEACALSLLGQGYRLAGNSIKGLDYHLRAVQMAEKTGNQSVMALVKNQMANLYKDRGDNEKAIQLYTEAKVSSQQGKHERLKVWPLMNIGATYLNANRPDSALMNLQRAYSQSLILKYDNMLAYILTNLGGTQSKLGNSGLAVTYFHMAIAEAKKNNSVRYQNLSYTGIAEHYMDGPHKDSCAYYARKAVEVVNGTVFSYLSVRPSWMLTMLYDAKQECDSTLKYARIYKAGNDSLFNVKANQQIQLMTFDEDLRQQERMLELKKAEDERWQNIQYALLAIGIVTLIALILTLSDRFITDTKYIHFFSILAMLLVFEFLGLFLHPFIGKITHHSPPLMLLCMVLIASFLVPLHHRLESWAIEKLTEKNRQVRLERAKKTIEMLSEKDEKAEKGEG